jgi:hypothetical protein
MLDLKNDANANVNISKSDMNINIINNCIRIRIRMYIYKNRVQTARYDGTTLTHVTIKITHDSFHHIDAPFPQAIIFPNQSPPEKQSSKTPTIKHP